MIGGKYEFTENQKLHGKKPRMRDKMRDLFFDLKTIVMLGKWNSFKNKTEYSKKKQKRDLSGFSNRLNVSRTERKTKRRMFKFW